MGFSLVPAPTATIVPFWGFSFALSGMMIPEDVFVSAAAGSTRTRSAKGLIVNLFIFKFF